MIRIAHISDTHFREDRRMGDLQEVLSVFIDEARAADVRLILHAGDFFDGESTPAERTALAHFLRSASCGAPVFGVRGNHDLRGEFGSDSPFNNLKSESTVRIMEAPTVLPYSALRWLVGGTEITALALLALPWFDKAGLVAQTEATTDAEQTRLATIEAAGILLRGLAAEAAQARQDGSIPILVSHCMVAGSEVSTGQTIQGITIELSPHDLLDVGAEYVALGHVHKTQEWFEGRIAYSGSPIRHNFGEPEEKGWRLVTFDGNGRLISNEFRPLPARKITLLEVDWTSNPVTAHTIASLPQFEGGPLVRFRYRIRPEDLHLVDEKILDQWLRAQGAGEVKIEAIIEHTARIRSEEIIAARSSFEKVLAYLQANNITLDDNAVERIRGKLSEIEEANRE